MAICIGLVQYLTTTAMNQAVPIADLDGLLQYVRQTDYPDNRQISGFMGDNAYVQIYDQTGKIVFYSPIASKVMTPGILEIIPSDTSDDYYHAMAYQTPEGKTEYIISMESLSDYSNRTNKYYRLDENLQVIASSASDRTSFTRDEIDLMVNQSYDFYGLTKHSYVNAAGEDRVLVYALPTLNENRYNRAVEMLRYSWVVLGVIYLLLVAFSIFWLNRKTKQLLQPLDTAIKQLISNQPTKIDYVGPIEFVQLYNQFNDLSERLQTSEQQRQRLDDNRRKMLADISHDLKTPITVIQGYAKAIQDEVIPADKQAQYITTIYQKSIHLTNLINTFFEYSRLHHPNLPIERVELNLTQFMQDYLAEKYQEIELANFQLEVNLPEEVIPYPVDAIQLRRAFDNLISNAIKYNPVGTTIAFDMKLAEDIQMTFSDNGTGLPLNLSRTLFEPFSVGDESRGTNGGNGLGLAITKRIIALHDGSIQLVEPARAPYKTQFLITFPTKKWASN